jgi:formamidopyrimidine-DNA glycosylase
VQTVVSQVAPLLCGAVVGSVVVHKAEVVRQGLRAMKAHLAGRTVRRIDRQGKWIIFRLAPSGEMVVHLGMTGRLTIEPATAPVAPHTHVRFRFVGWLEELRFRDPRRFGGIWFFGEGEAKAAAAHHQVGPDALSIRAPVLGRICRRSRQIKALLLDQRIIGGLGNIYSDEILFAAGIHPHTRACKLTEGQIRGLAGVIRKTLRRAIAAQGSTIQAFRQTDGSAGRFQDEHQVYGREGLPCPRCGRAIRRIQAAGRSSHVCTKCQRLRRC